MRLLIGDLLPFDLAVAATLAIAIAFAVGFGMGRGGDAMSPPPRRLRSFSLRMLMLLVVVCSVAAWLATFAAKGRRIAHERRSLIERSQWGALNDILIYERPTQYLPWQRWIFGDTLGNEIQIYERASPQDVQEVRRAFPEAPARWYKELSPRNWVVTKEAFSSTDPAEISAARRWLASPQTPVQASAPTP